MATHLLTARMVETAAPQAAPYSLKDGGSLFLHITPTGGKLWRYRYRIGNTAQVFAIGRFPEVSLPAARKARDEARALVARGIHPLTDRRARLSQQIERNQHTFESVARRWMALNTGWSRTYARQVKTYLERDIFPAIGNFPITSITVSILRPLVIRVAERGASAAMAVRQWLSQIFVYAAQQGWCEQDPASLLKRLVRRPAVRHHPPLPWQEIPRFMQKLDHWNGHLVTRTALRLAAYTFVRTIELRRATWDQIDLAAATWSIPAEHMKMRRPHTVPLSRQVVGLLEQLRSTASESRYVLPNQRSANKAIGPSTLNHAIDVLGYHGQFSTHGFRATATTLLGLLSYPENRVDLQLAHVRNDSSRAPYDHTKYVSSRRLMMQDWADILDALAAGATLDDVTRQFGPMSERRAELLRVVEREQ